MREIKLRLRDTPIAAQATSEFWARKREDTRRAESLVQDEKGDWK